MKFENAFVGAKKIFTAEILSLVATVCSAFVLAFTFLGAVSVEEGSGTGAVASLGGIAIFGIAAAIVAVIAFIFKIMGVNSASKDEPAFKIVLYLIIGGIVVAIAASFIPNETVKNIFTIIGDVVNVAVTVYIIQGFRNLAVKLGRDDVDTKGNNIFKIIIAMYLLIFVARIITLISSGAASLTIAGIFAIVAAILYIVVYVFYLSFLNQAKLMLA